MNDQDIHQSDRLTLVRILEAGSTDQGDWASDELGAILWFQLSAPLTADLGLEDAATKDRLVMILAATQPAIKTFHDLFHHPAPPVELLQMVKDFAKAQRGNPNSRLPAGIATVLYYLPIVLALKRCGQVLTELGATTIQDGARWAIAQDWVDDQTRTLFRLALP